MKFYRQGNAIAYERKSGLLTYVSKDDVDIHEAADGKLALTMSPETKSAETRVVLPTEIQNAQGEYPYTTINQVLGDIYSGDDVTIQDSTSPPLDSYFLNAPGASFNIAADTIPSGVDILNYDFEASPGHGIIAFDEILLLDVAADREIYAVVMAVNGDTITIDRPIDYTYTAATTFGRFVDSNMAVDGSVTPVVYTIRGGERPADVVRTLITMLSGSSMDDSKFGSLPALTRGLVFRVVDGYQKTVFNFKTNQDIKQFCYDVNYSDKAGAGLYGLSSRITFGGQHTHGMVFRVSGTSRVQWIVQDDLTGLIALRVTGEGSSTSGEIE